MSLNSEYAGLQTNCHHACTQRQESRTTTGIHTTTRKATPTELTFDSRNEALLTNQLQLLGLLQSSQIPARVDSAPQPVKPSYLFSLLKCNLNGGKALSAIGEFKASDNKLCLPDSSAADSLPATVFPVAEIFRREIHAAVTGTLVPAKPTDFWKSVERHKGGRGACVGVEEREGAAITLREGTSPGPRGGPLSATVCLHEEIAEGGGGVLYVPQTLADNAISAPGTKDSVGRRHSLYCCSYPCCFSLSIEYESRPESWPIWCCCSADQY